MAAGMLAVGGCGPEAEQPWGPALSMGLGCPPPGVPPGPSGVQRPSPRTSSALGRTKGVSQIGRARDIPEGVPRDHRPPTTPTVRGASPAPPLASVSSGFPTPQARSPHGVSRAVTLGLRGGAKTPRQSSGGAAPKGRARALLPRALAAPPQPRPLRHLSCGSCASPSRAAASPRPPSSLLPQSPLRLRRTASAARACPPLLPIGWARPAPGSGDDSHWAPQLSGRALWLPIEQKRGWAGPPTVLPGPRPRSASPRPRPAPFLGP